MEQQQLTSTQAILKTRAIDTPMDSSREYAFERRQLAAAAMRAKQASAGNPLLFTIESIVNDRIFQARRGAVEYFEAHRDQVLALLRDISPNSDFALSIEDARGSGQVPREV